MEAWDPVNQPPLVGGEFTSSLASLNDQFDVVETGLAAVFKSASTEIPDGVPIDEWVDASVLKYLPGCYVPRSQQPEITIDGQSGRIWEDCPNTVVATVVAGRRLYLFTCCTTVVTPEPSSTRSPPRSTCVQRTQRCANLSGVRRQVAECVGRRPRWAKPGWPEPVLENVA